MSERIEKLKGAIETTHGCIAHHMASTLIRETFQGKVAWEGVVETFTLFRHPKAKRCYAWVAKDGADLQFTTVLELPPVDSPQAAVKVAIASKARQ